MNSLSLALFATLAASTAQEPAQEPARGMTPPERVHCPEPVVLPVDYASGRPRVEVTFGGRGPFQMILDTGAMGVVVTESLAAELGLSKVGETRIGDPTNPEANLVDLVRVETLALGGARFEGFDAVSWGDIMGLESRGIRGIVGLPLFEELLLTIDRGKGELRFERGALPEPGGRVIAIERGEGGLISFPIEVHDIRVDAHLDSGNSRHTVLPAGLMEKLPLVAGSQRKGRGRRASGPVEFTMATLDGKLRVGPVVFVQPTVSFDSTLAWANLGGDFFDACVPTIDLANERIRLGPAGPKTATRTAGGPRRMVKSAGARRSLGIEMAFSGSPEMTVQGVVTGSLAESVGLKAGDVLKAIDGKAVSHDDPSPLTDALSKSDAFEITITRDEKTLKIAVPAEKAGEKAGNKDRKSGS